SVGTDPATQTVADLNSDGRRDLAVVNTFDANLGILINAGSGTFKPQATIGLGIEAYGLAIADFDNDGLLDLAVADYNGGRAGVLLQQRQGVFSQPFFATVGPQYSAFSLAA